MKRPSIFSPLVLVALLAAFTSLCFAQIPPANPADTKKLYGDMLAKGKAPVLDYAKKLPENEARYALEGMARRALESDAKPEWRGTYEAGVLEALEANPNDYLVKMLRWAGTEKSVDGLSKLLGHESLYDNAVRALITIGGDTSAAALRASLPTVEGPSRIAHIQALGTLQDAASIDLLLKEAAGDNKLFAIQSLAELGDPKADALIMGHLEVNKRSTGFAWALNYAKNLARTGHRDKGAALCRKLYTEKTEAKFGHVQCRALSVLADIEGAGAADDLLSAFDGPSAYVQAHSAKLLAKIPGKVVNEKVAAKFKAAKPAGQRVLVDVLASRNDRASMDLLAGTLASDDDVLRDAAIAALSESGGEQAAQALGKSVLAGNTGAWAALARVAEPAQISGLYSQADTAEEKSALLNALDSAGAKGQMAAVLKGLQDKDEGVRKTAAKVAKKAAQPSDMAPLFSVLQKADASDRRRIVGAMQAAGQREANVAKRVDAFDALADGAKGRDLDDLLTLLAATEHPKALVRIAGTDSDHAVRTLAKWKTTAALPALFKVAETGSDANHAVAMKAIKRLAESPADIKKAAEAARSKADKALFEKKLGVAKIQSIKGWANLTEGNDPKANWGGDLTDLTLKDGVLVFGKKNKNVFSKKVYSDFIFDFEFKLTAGANNGIGIRVPKDGNAAYDGLEVQVLDDTADRYKELKDWQFHGSVYGAAPAKKGHLKPVGEWNHQTILCIGQHVKVILNGEVINDVYLDQLKPLHGKEIKGLKSKSGHITFAGHGHEVHFRKVRIKSYAVAKPGDLPKKGQGFKEIFNGKNIDGWKGLVGNPKTRAAMPSNELAEKQAAANERAAKNWMVKNGVLVFNGKGQNLCTATQYADFDFIVDWKIEKHGDSGLYLRGTPQVQMWDTTNPAQLKHGNDKGSGGLWNNKKNPRDPVEKADKPVGEWNRFYVRMVNDRVNLWLNGKHVVKDTILENYWEPGKPVYSQESIELQNHGNTLYFDNIWVRELPR